jgi:hypothetical protein
VRRPIWSSDYDGLPVTPYSTPDELAAALSDLLPPPPRGRVAERFGTGQALEAIARAARPSRSRGVIPS